MSKITGDVININLLKRVFQYVKPYKNIFIYSVALTILLAVVAPVRPFLIKYTLDEHILKGDYQGLLNMTIIMIVLLVLQSIIQYSHTLLTNTLGQSAIKDLRIAVFNHITKLRLKFFDRTPIGQLITRTVSDLETIADIFSEGLIVIIGDVLMVIVIIAVMLYRDVALTIIVLLPLPLLPLSFSACASFTLSCMRSAISLPIANCCSGGMAFTWSSVRPISFRMLSRKRCSGVLLI